MQFNTQHKTYIKVGQNALPYKRVEHVGIEKVKLRSFKFTDFSCSVMIKVS